MKNEIVIFKNQNIKLEVNMKDETVWLSLEQIADLFNRDKSVISRHIKNAMVEELDNSVVANFATTAKDGKTYKVDYYNLDMIISVGYRVKSKNGIIFRRWVNKILKEYLINGYVINQKRLEYLEKTVKLIDIASRIDDNISDNETKKIIKIINDYSNALNLLDDFDYKRVNKPKGRTSNKKISHEECKNIICSLRFNENSNLFAIEKNKDGLNEIISSIYQTFDSKELYPSIEEKASNFLYMLVKNHIYIDGNKRVAAALFIYFLNFYNILIKDNKFIIGNNTLVAITILIAQSDPKEKDVIVDLVTNFLVV